MPPTTDQVKIWKVVFADDSLVITVDAVYPTSDDKLPGWTVFKNEHHKIVLGVRDDRVLYVQPLDEGSDEAESHRRAHA